MKKIFLLSAALFLLPSHAQAALNVFACEPEWGALVTELGGAQVSVTSATNGREDPHHVRAKPSLLAAMRKADLVVCTGAGLEAGWLPVLIRQAAGAGVQPGAPGYVMVSSAVKLVGAPAKVDRAMGDVHPEGNPHIHTDPRNFLPIARLLAARLAEVDPGNTTLYQKNLNDFTARWSTQIQAWSTLGASLRVLPVVVYHDEWAYLNAWLGLNEIATLEAKPGVPPTPAHLHAVLDAATAAKVKVILLSPFDNDDAAEWLSEKTGAKLVRLPFTVGGTEGADTLDKVFQQTVAEIKAAAQ